MTDTRCAILLGYDIQTGTASTPVAAVAARRAELAVSWLPFTSGSSEGWRETLAAARTAPTVTDWPTQLDRWAASSNSTQALELVDEPTHAIDLQDAAEQVMDVLLASPASRPVALVAVPPAPRAVAAAASDDQVG